MAINARSTPAWSNSIAAVWRLCRSRHRRHTTAMHLLQSNVDLNMIRSWLGHASIETTNGYVEIDLEMKRKTLRSAEKLIPKRGKRDGSWRDDDHLLSWLAKL